MQLLSGIARMTTCGIESLQMHLLWVHKVLRSMYKMTTCVTAWDSKYSSIRMMNIVNRVF